MAAGGRPATARRSHPQRRADVRIVFGSCRRGDPEPTDLERAWPEEVRALGIDALWTYAKQLQRGEVEWPDVVLLLGDQVYADEVSPETLAFIKSRRGTDDPPGEQIADFEEYTRLYRESWSEPDIRWLLSTVPTAMIFDDHDVNDDWNISWRWIDEMRRTPWWEARITGAFMAYWLYQHLGNLSPPQLDAETTLPRAWRRTTQGHCCASSRTRGIASPRRAAGPSTAISATRACSCSTRAQPACSRTAGAR